MREINFSENDKSYLCKVNINRLSHNRKRWKTKEKINVTNMSKKLNKCERHSGDICMSEKSYYKYTMRNYAMK